MYWSSRSRALPLNGGKKYGARRELIFGDEVGHE